MLTPMDDYPVHQIAEPIRQVATSDRNFYDRYYFNCYPTESPDVFLIVGLGQYPNLGVMDAFAVLRRGDDHIVARMSKALGADRTDTTVGPLRIEVLEGLQKLRVVLEPGSEYDLSFDITFDATIPAALEPSTFAVNSNESRSTPHASCRPARGPDRSPSTGRTSRSTEDVAR